MNLPLRASNEGLLRPRVARAQETNRLPPFFLVIFASPPVSQQGGLVDPRLRASNEHIPIVRVPRAGGQPGYPALY